MEIRIGIIPLDPETTAPTFQDFNTNDDRQRWRGCQTSERLQGGGNNPHEHSKENNG